MMTGLKKANTLLVVAHGNSLRGIIKHLKHISDEDIVRLNLPTAVPYVLEFDESLEVVNDYFLGNPEEIKRLMEVIASLHGEGLSGAHLEITKDGKLLKATVQEKEIEDDKDYTVATIDYLADGNDGLTPFINADKRECPDGLTLRGLFLDYVRQQTAAGKKITSKLDGRITVVPASDRK